MSSLEPQKSAHQIQDDIVTQNDLDRPLKPFVTSPSAVVTESVATSAASETLLLPNDLSVPSLEHSLEVTSTHSLNTSESARDSDVLASQLVSSNVPMLSPPLPDVHQTSVISAAPPCASDGTISTFNSCIPSVSDASFSNISPQVSTSTSSSQASCSVINPATLDSSTITPFGTAADGQTLRAQKIDAPAASTSQPVSALEPVNIVSSSPQQSNASVVTIIV